MGKRGNKVCCVCNQDVSRRYRLKDAAGRYYCDACFAKLGTRSAASYRSSAAASPAVKAKGVKSSAAPPSRKNQPVMREIPPDAKEQFRRACKSVREIIIAADGLLTLWSEFIETDAPHRLARQPQAVQRRDELFAATRKWLEQERQRLGIDEATADILENGENPFDTTSVTCFLR